MNIADFNAIVERELTALAVAEARRIAAGRAPAVATPRTRLRRDRKSARRQYAPKGCWIALSRANGTPAPTGRLAEAYAVAEAALAAGAAERSTVTRLMVDARPGWSRVTASGCISRLVARGRLAVVNAPRATA
jgi:hypothetical protein